MSFTVSETNYVPKCFVEAAVKRKIEHVNFASAYGTILENDGLIISLSHQNCIEENRYIFYKNEKIKMKENEVILEKMKNKNEKLTKEIEAANLEKNKMKDVVTLAKLVLKNNTQVGKLEVENRKLKRDLEKKLNEPKEIKQDEDNNNSVLRPLETTGTGMNEPEPVVSSGKYNFFHLSNPSIHSFHDFFNFLLYCRPSDLYLIIKD